MLKAATSGERATTPNLASHGDLITSSPLPAFDMLYIIAHYLFIYLTRHVLDKFKYIVANTLAKALRMFPG